ncbi:hypothetical protein SNE40_010322 [Patella caerulea]|uniref:Uncharacterized protein n=1 Tax=Patella caerulea TaxID=87958 RepID=A0AAN8PSQ5_PATCE
MENSIVHDFQNLRVFSNGNIIIMDQLVKDLTNALEESSKGQKAQAENVAPGLMSRRIYKKRRGKKRRSDLHLSPRCGTISEASESSIDDTLRGYIDHMAQFSDSDEILIGVGKHMHRLTVPINESIPQVESDSVTENFSPTRPQRRRRKYKNMAVDPPMENETDVEHFEPQTLQGIDRNLKHIGGGDYNQIMIPQEIQGESILPGKRKRSSKCRAESGNFSGPSTSLNSSDLMEQGNYSQESSSLSSSETESDGGIMTNDEAREADDEQSDFFHEPGPVCGVPSNLPWWENERVTDQDMASSVNFQRFITKTFDNLPRSSQLSFKARVSRLMIANGREIRVGRRKLKEKIPGYSMTSYLQDREKWMLSGPYPQLCSTANNSNQTYDIKRQRKTPPPSPDYKEGTSTEGVNIKTRKLRDMSWVQRKSLEMESAGPFVKLLRRHDVSCALSDS